MHAEAGWWLGGYLGLGALVILLLRGVVSAYGMGWRHRPEPPRGPIATARNNVHATLSSEPDFKKLKINKSDCRHILNQCQRNKWLEIVDYLDAYRKTRQRWSLTGSGRAFAGISAPCAPSAPSCNEDADSKQGVEAAPSAPCA